MQYSSCSCITYKTNTGGKGSPMISTAFAANTKETYFTLTVTDRLLMASADTSVFYTKQCPNSRASTARTRVTMTVPHCMMNGGLSFR